MDDLLRYIATGGAPVIVLLLVIAALGAKGVWIFGWIHEEIARYHLVEIALLRNELKAERELNQRLLGVTEQAVTRRKAPAVRKEEPS